MDLAPIQTRFICKLLLYFEHKVHSSVVYLSVHYRPQRKFYIVTNQQLQKYGHCMLSLRNNGVDMCSSCVKKFILKSLTFLDWRLLLSICSQHLWTTLERCEYYEYS
jgi:hypothetical protein